MHESKLDGYRCLAQVKPSRARLWSRAGTPSVSSTWVEDGL